MTEKRVSKHFRDTEKQLNKYFPLFTYNNAIGAYDFLCQRGYQKQADYISEGLREIVYKYRNGKENEPRKTQPRDRRRLVVGTIFEEGLLDSFLKEVWTEKHNPLDYRMAKMNEWYEDYKDCYKSRYGDILKKS